MLQRTDSPQVDVRIYNLTDKCTCKNSYFVADDSENRMFLRFRFLASGDRKRKKKCSITPFVFCCFRLFGGSRKQKKLKKTKTKKCDFVFVGNEAFTM